MSVDPQPEAATPEWTDPAAGRSRVVDHRFGSWQEVVAAFSVNLRGFSWIFRGQEDARWPLVTRLQRLLQQHAPENAYTLAWENAGIGFFKRQVRSHLASVPDDADIVGWLALMQHYGAPTRLLDWTFSPFVACYFALAPESNAEEAVIWALDADQCLRKLQGSHPPFPFDHLGVMGHSTDDGSGGRLTTVPALERGEGERQNEWVRWVISTTSKWPLPVLPLAPDARMVAQQAVFTCAGDLRSPIEHLMNKDQWSAVERRPGAAIAGTDGTWRPLATPSDVIEKYRLDRSMRSDALEGLRGMGLTRVSLFPGLDGVGAATALHMQFGPTAIEDLFGGLPLP